MYDMNVDDKIAKLRAALAERDKELDNLKMGLTSACEVFLETVKERDATIERLREALAPFQSIVADFEVGSEDWQRAAEVYAATAPADMTVEYKGDGVVQPQYRDGAIGTHVPEEEKP